MPDIKTVVLRDSWYDRGEYGSKPILCRGATVTRLGLVSPNTVFKLLGTATCLDCCKGSYLSSFLGHHRAFSVTDSRIRALTLCAANERLGMLLELFDLCHTDFQHTLNVFQHLREIDLSFSTYRGKALNETYFKAGYMARILSSAKLLEAGAPLWYGQWPTSSSVRLAVRESTIWPRLGSQFSPLFTQTLKSYWTFSVATTQAWSTSDSLSSPLRGSGMKPTSLCKMLTVGELRN
jgi:hypothetical protein